MSYRDDVKAEKGQGLERFQGVDFLLPGSPHSCDSLGGEKGATVFRIYPEIAKDGTELPIRASEVENDFTYWMRMEKVARRFGVNQSFSVLVRVAGRDRNYGGPIERFTNVIRKQLHPDKGNPEIFPTSYRQWTRMSGALPNVEYMGLVQGMLFEARGKKMVKNGKAAPVHPVVLFLTKSARNSLETIGNQSPEIDFISSKGGRAVFIQYHPAEGKELANYSISVSQKPIPLSLDTIKAEWRPWEELLKFHTEEQQMALLINHFPAEALDYVFGSTTLAALLPPSARGSWARMTQGRVAGGVVPQVVTRETPTYVEYEAPVAPTVTVNPKSLPEAPVVSRSGVPAADPEVEFPQDPDAPEGDFPDMEPVPTEKPKKGASVVEAEFDVSGVEATPSPGAPIGDPVADKGRSGSIRERMMAAKKLASS